MPLQHLSVEKSIEKPEWLEKQQLEEEGLLEDSFILYIIIAMINEIEWRIAKKEFFQIWKKTTICLLTLDNWFEIVWESHVQFEENFEKELWEKYAYEKALDKLWEFCVFSSAEK